MAQRLHKPYAQGHISCLFLDGVLHAGLRFYGGGLNTPSFRAAGAALAAAAAALAAAAAAPALAAPPLDTKEQCCLQYCCPVAAAATVAFVHHRLQRLSHDAMTRSNAVLKAPSGYTKSLDYLPPMCGKPRYLFPHRAE